MSYFKARFASVQTTSCLAKWRPGQIPGPPPKGIYAPFRPFVENVGFSRFEERTAGSCLRESAALSCLRNGPLFGLSGYIKNLSSQKASRG